MHGAVLANGLTSYKVHAVHGQKFMASRTVRPLARRALQKTSLEMTSSFFWSSPWMLAAPARPVRLLMPARFTRLAICAMPDR